MTPLEIADALGVFVFALSGGLAASRRGMDLFGILVVCLLPAIGGGTLRDLLLDRPVFWLEHSNTILIALAGGLATAILGERIARFKTLIWFDAMGLALFCVIGAQAAHAMGHDPVVVIMMGTITASFGGLLRDVVCNEVPLILREDIYATAALVGALTFWAAMAFGASETVAMVAGGLTAFSIRAIVITMKTIKPKLLLPFRKKDGRE
ncbi:trimeric intracellular cation channel family protein [Hyphomonas sp. FCG-A18]|uniref:trimeric intracellular cation channel family protein n=1 Tax=Hyphomonas sp. FCG-A18 TaxID=3080019 RepID=UPI002B289C82|nr:trimeric intracellular cation channel family protein [Hyphomonas sp. FCG-A18]